VEGCAQYGQRENACGMSRVEVSFDQIVEKSR